MTVHAWKISTLVLGSALAFVVSTSNNVASADAQPHMKTALATLRVARSQLEKAEHDKGGHRAAALRLTDQAIDEVQKGVDFDNAHSGAGIDPEPEASATE